MYTLSQTTARRINPRCHSICRRWHGTASVGGCLAAGCKRPLADAHGSVLSWGGTFRVARFVWKITPHPTWYPVQIRGLLGMRPHVDFPTIPRLFVTPRPYLHVYSLIAHIPDRCLNV